MRVLRILARRRDADCQVSSTKARRSRPRPPPTPASGCASQLGRVVERLLLAQLAHADWRRSRRIRAGIHRDLDQARRLVADIIQRGAARGGAGKPYWPTPSGASPGVDAPDPGRPKLGMSGEIIGGDGRRRPPPSMRCCWWRTQSAASATTRRGKVVGACKLPVFLVLRCAQLHARIRTSLSQPDMASNDESTPGREGVTKTKTSAVPPASSSSSFRLLLRVAVCRRRANDGAEVEEVWLDRFVDACPCCAPFLGAL